MKRTFKLFSLILAVAVLLSACAPKATTEPTATPSASMPNPAAQYCVDQGFESEIRTADDGSQYGVCKFPDGSECDEWAYQRGECKQGDYDVAPAPGSSASMPNPAAQYCVDQGFESEIRTADDGSQYGVCKFTDGSECDEWSYQRGECKQGDYDVAPTPGSSASIANPAAQYCVDQGFESEIRTTTDGSQYGVCKFTDGTECDEWAYRRGECKQGDYKVAPTPTPTTTN